VLHPKEHAAEVDSKHVLPFLERDLGESLSRAVDAGVVDYEVEPAERFGHPRDRVADVLLVGHVGDDRGGPPPGLLDEPRCLVRRGVAHVDDADRRAAGTEPDRACATDADARPRDESHPPGEIVARHQTSLFLCSSDSYVGPGADGLATGPDLPPTAMNWQALHDVGTAR
jgi:hypothetical protein